MTNKQAAAKLAKAEKLTAIANALGVDEASPEHEAARKALAKAHALIDEVAKAADQNLIRD